MRKTRLILTAALLPLLAAGQGIIIGKHRSVGVATTLPALSNPTCMALGATTPQTSGPVDTTGAEVVAVEVVWGTNFGSPTVAVTDNKGNGSPTALTMYSAGNIAMQIFYWLNPAVGSGHTFTVTGVSGIYYSAICVSPIINVSGAFDAGSDSGNASTSSATCQPASSINPGAGNHMVITSVEVDTFAGGIPGSIDSGYVGSGSVDNSGNNYAIQQAYLVQSPGSNTQPTWTNNRSVTGCAIASFH